MSNSQAYKNQIGEYKMIKKTGFILILTATVFISATTSQKGERKSETQPAKIEGTTTSSFKKATTIHLTKADFLSKIVNYETNPTEWKYLGDKPAIIDFYASWCGPCKVIAPVLEELAAEYDGQIYIYKVDTEKEQELAAAFGVRSIPSLLFVPMAGKPQMAQGAIPKATLKEAIDKILLKK